MKEQGPQESPIRISFLSPNLRDTVEDLSPIVSLEDTNFWEQC